jgi:hypothetical protein
MQALEAMWLANIVFLPLAIILIYKAKNDAKLFDFSNLTMLFKRPIKKEAITVKSTIFAPSKLQYEI